LVTTASFRTHCDSNTRPSRVSAAVSITRSLASRCPASVSSSAVSYDEVLRDLLVLTAAEQQLVKTLQPEKVVR
jgi:hypothetical protein